MLPQCGEWWVVVMRKGGTSNGPLQASTRKDPEWGKLVPCTLCPSPQPAFIHWRTATTLAHIHIITVLTKWRIALRNSGIPLHPNEYSYFHQLKLRVFVCLLVRSVAHFSLVACLSLTQSSYAWLIRVIARLSLLLVWQFQMHILNKNISAIAVYLVY